jgi:anthranilate phosphoribosyltransferase
VSDAIKPALAQLVAGERLTGAALEVAFGEIVEGAATPAQIGAFLTAMLPHMTDPEALAAGARALRTRMIAVEAPDGAIDVCGTGGDGAHTLNISTAVALVVAGCGVPVAKHGNRAMSSKSGAADVLEALGDRLSADPATLARCLAEANVAFLFAQNHHPAMRNVAAPRRELAFRTIFNLLGPLSNPAGVTRQLVGVFAGAYVEPVAEALRLLGADHAWVVHGAGGLDELSCAGANKVGTAARGAPRTISVNAQDAGLPTADNAGVLGGSVTENAAALRRLLDEDAEGTAYASFVQFNAAAALLIAGRASTLAEGAEMARESLQSGRARDALDRLITITQAAP